jgi:hypothetical protein
MAATACPGRPARRSTTSRRPARIDWQVHVYGAAGDALSAWCHHAGLPLRVFDWERAHEHAGLARDAAYLVRPDGYVALADADGRPEALRRIFGRSATGASPDVMTVIPARGNPSSASASKAEALLRPFNNLDSRCAGMTA